MRWALLPILWAVLLLPSSNVGWFDGLPLDTGPELIGLLLLLPLTVSRALRRHWRRDGRLPSRRCQEGVVRRLAEGRRRLGPSRARRARRPRTSRRRREARAPGGRPLRGLPRLLPVRARAAPDGAVRAILREPMVPPRGHSHRSRHRLRSRDVEPRVRQFQSLQSVMGRRTPGRPLRDRLPIEVAWQGAVERPDPWLSRVTYVGEVTLRLQTGGAGQRQRRRCGWPPATARRPPPPCRFRRDVIASSWPTASTTERDGPSSRPPPPGRLFGWSARWSRGHSSRARSSTPRGLPLVWRLLAAVVDSAVLALGATVATRLRRARPAGLVADRCSWPYRACWSSRAGPAIEESPGRPRRLPGAARPGARAPGPTVAPPAGGRILRGGLPQLLPGALVDPRNSTRSSARRPTDSLFYESHARAILETWSLEGGEPVFRYQPGFRYWRFLERLVLGEGDPFVLIVGLTLLAWGYLWAIARLWPRPRPPGRAPSRSPSPRG